MNPTRQERPFLGYGWRFPLGVDGRGGLPLSKLELDIQESVYIILATAQGERVMRPEFGSTIHEFQFAPNDASTAGLLAYHVQGALVRWEPRIEVTGVNVHPDPDDYSRLLIEIEYLVKATNDEVNMVYPYYLIPTEESRNAFTNP